MSKNRIPKADRPIMPDITTRMQQYDDGLLSASEILGDLMIAFQCVWQSLRELEDYEATKRAERMGLKKD